MPEIPVDSQIFDIVFHPTFSTVYTGLLTGHVQAFAYNEQGNHEQVFSLRPSKRSCRSLSVDQDGSHLYAVGKSKALSIIDTTTEQMDIRKGAHDAPINRVKTLMPWLLSTGDDDGVVKLWDPRQQGCTRTYNQHFDFITDFLWMADKRQLLATSADGTLSVMDVRSKKPEPIAQSEDQEDELLSVVSIKGGAKIVVGTQLGILSVFNRTSGWGDCVDRIPGHPLSVDALCNIPPIPNVDSNSTILTGSSDGYVRAVQILPTKLLGVVADHGEWPVERIAVGGGERQLTLSDDHSNGSQRGTKVIESDEDHEAVQEEENSIPRRWWVGSAGHEEVLRMTDLEGFFRELEGKGEDGGDEKDVHELEAMDAKDDEEEEPEPLDDESIGPMAAGEDIDSSDESDEPKAKNKRKRKPEKEEAVKKKKPGKNAIIVDQAFEGL